MLFKIPIKPEGAPYKILDELNCVQEYANAIKYYDLFKLNQSKIQNYLNKQYKDLISFDLIRGYTNTHYIKLNKKINRKKIQIPVQTYLLGCKVNNNNPINYIMGFCLAFITSLVKYRSSGNHYYIERMAPEINGEIENDTFIVRIRARLAEVHYEDLFNLEFNYD